MIEIQCFECLIHLGWATDFGPLYYCDDCKEDDD